MEIKKIKELLALGPSDDQLKLLHSDKRTTVHKLLLAYEKRKKLMQEEHNRFKSLLNYEAEYYKKGVKAIAGVDEVGRGPLAGPLVIAAVILPEDVFIEGLNDSKKLLPSKRKKIFVEIVSKAIDIAVNIVSVSNIDKLNIYKATQEGMVQVLNALKIRPEIALVDAMPLNLETIKTHAIIHGDALSASIAAASVVAKVMRDEMMERLGSIFYNYDFAGNKGYGSKEHMRAIEEFGATEWHRRSFAPVRHKNLEPVKSFKNMIYYPLCDTYEFVSED